MKSKSAFRSFLAFAGSALLFSTQANAAVYYWDTDGATLGLGNRAGIWGVNTFMATVPSGILSGSSTTGNPKISGSDVIYFGTNNLSLGVTASTIEVSSNGVTINSIVFGSGQSTPVTLNGSGTITLAGGTPTVTVNNASDTISAVIAGSGGITKAGSGTLILSGANIFTGGVNINSGTLQLNSTSGSLAYQDLNFNGTGVFNVVGAAGGSTQAMAYLNFNAGDGTVQSTYGGAGVTTLDFADISAISTGATVNFTTSGGNSTNNRITTSGSLASSPNSYLYKSIFFNGSSYAAYDSGGFLRAVGAGDANFASVGPGTDMGTRSSADTVLLTGSLSAQGDTSVSSINLGAYNITMSGTSSLLQTDGLLSSGSSNATIGGGTTPLLQTTTYGTDMVIRVNGSSDQLTISSSIVDNGGSALTKSGAGTLVLSGANTYTGITTINAGTLAVSGGDSIADTGSVALANAAGAVFRLDNNETITNLYGGGFAGGNVNVQGNTLTILNAGSFGGTFSGTSGGGVTVSSGNLTLSNKNAFAGTISLLGASQLTLAYGNDGTSSTATVSSGGTISMSDGTSLLLNPTAQASAGVAGTSINSSLGGVGISNPIVVTSGVATIKNGAGGDAKYFYSGGVTGGTSGAQTLNILQGASGGNGERTDILFSGIIQNGSGGTLGVNVDFQSASTSNQGAAVNLSGQNTFTGPIVVSNTKNLTYNGPSTYQGGWFAIGGENSYNGSTRVATMGTGYLGGGNYTNTITLATGAVLDYLSSANQTLGGVISGGGALVKEGTGTLTLGAANTYTGGTTVSAGTLLLSGANNMPGTGALAVNSGGTFSLADGTARTTTANGGLTIASGSNFVFDWVGGAADSLTTTANVSTTAGNIIGIGINAAAPSGGPFTLISAGAGSTLNNATYYLANATNYTATLGKTATSVTINNYASATALTNIYWSGNKLAAAATAGVDNAWALSDGTKSNWSSTTTAYTATPLTPGSTANVIFATGQVGKAQQSTVLGANVTVNSVTIDDATAVTIAGSSGQALTLLSTSSTAGTVASPGSAISVTANAGNPTISANVVLGANQTWNVANAKTLTVSGTVFGTGNLTKADAGTVTLSGYTNYTGVTTASAGTLQFANQNSLYSNNTANWTAANIKVNSGATLAFNVGGTNQFTNPSITTLLTNLGGLGGTISNNGLQSGSSIGFDTTGTTTFTIADNIADSTGTGGGAIGVTKLGTNTLVLTGTNTYSGATTIAAGTLRVGNSAALGGANNTLVFRGGTLQASGAFTSGSTRAVTMTGSGTIDTNGYAVSIAGATSGAFGLTKSGLGTLTLSNTLSHTGGTTVSAGTLLLSGANNLPTSGTLALSSGGAFSLADGTVRNTTASTLTLATNSTLSFDWSSTGTVDNLAPTVAITPSAGIAVGININRIGTPTGGGNLLTGIAGSTLNNPNYFLVNNTNYTATITKPSATGAGSVSIGSYAAATALTDAYWKGGLANAAGNMAYSSGTASNWVPTVGGTTTGVVPGGPAVNVIFGATGASNQSAVTTGADMNLGSITFNDSTAVTIAGSPNTITLNSTSANAATTTGALQAVTAGSAISVTQYANANNTISANLALAANQTWNIASGKNLTVSGGVSGNSSLTKADSGILTLSGANTFSGGLTIMAGTVSINTPNNTTNALGSDDVTIGDAANTGAAATLQFHGAGSFPTFTNDINVTGNGTDIIGVTAWNPVFSGGLNLTNNLILASNNSAGSTMTFNGGVTGTGNITVSIGNSSSASLVTFGSILVNHSGTLTYNNAAVNIGSVTGVAGTGTGTNTITGGVGSNVTAINQNSNSNPLTIQTNALTVNSGGTTLNASGTALFTLSGGINGSGNLTLNTNNNTNGILLSANAVNNTGTITNSGTGTATTSITGGVGSNVTGILQTSNSSPLTISGGALNVNTTVTTTLTASGTAQFTISGGVAGSIGDLILNTNNNTNGILFSTKSVNNLGTIFNSGTGTATTFITGGVGNLVTGITQTSDSSALTISTTALSVGNTTTLTASGTAQFTLSGGVTDVGNLILNTNNDTNGILLSTNAVNNNGRITNSGTGTAATTISAVIGTSVTSVVQNSPTSTLILSGANTYTGVTNIDSGILSISSLANGGTSSGIGASTNAADKLILNGGTLKYTGAAVSTNRLFSLQSDSTIDSSGSGAVNFTNTGSMGFNGGTDAKTLTLGGSNTGNNTLAAVIGDNTGATSLAKNGAGNWILTGSNTYTGTTTVSGGTLQFANQTSLYGNNTANWTAANINVNSGATLAFNVGGTNQFTAPSITTLLTNLGGLGGAISNNGLQAGASIGFDTTNAAGNTFTVADNIADSTGTGGGAIGVAKLGTNTLVLTGTNTYTGATSVNAGVLRAGAAASGKAFGTNSAVTLGATPGAVLDLNNYDQTIGSLAGGSLAGGNVTLGSGTLTVGGDNTSTGYAGVISGTGGLIKTGSGSLTLTGANTYAGTTTVSSGSLVINGAVASTSLVVNGSLSGSGTMANATISGTGSVNPGNSPGILTARALNPTVGTSYNFEFTAANTMPAWNSPTVSLNDVLRLTDATTPITAPMTSTNLVSIFLNVGSIASGNVFTGGFFTDKTASFLSSISGASFKYYIADPIGAVEYNGNKYGLYGGPLGFKVNTVAKTADFGSGNVNGYTTEFTVGDPYLLWSGGGGTFGSDDNGDGVPNGLAWLLGASGPGVNARTYLPVATTSSGDITLQFSALNGASRGTASIKVQYSKDLGTTDAWTIHEAEVPDTSSTVNGIVFTIQANGNYNTVSAKIPASAAGTGKKLFTRVNASMP